MIYLPLHKKHKLKKNSKTDIITLANAFAVKYTLDFNKNYLNEQDKLDVEKKDRFLKHFLDFLKQFTPNLHTVRSMKSSLEKKIF